MPQVEMGQGVYTAIAMILAEELDADFVQVVLEHAPPSDKLYGNPIFGIQVTGNSNSIRAFWMKLRKAGAAARAMLVAGRGAAMAGRSGKLHGRKRARSSTTASSRTARLWRARATAPAGWHAAGQDPPLKDPKDFTLIGKPLKRLDTPDKVDGKAIYGIDAMLPDMKFATLAQSPVFGGKVDACRRQRRAKNFPASGRSSCFDDLVAVVGDHMWAAKQGLDALEIDWDEGPNANVNSADIWNELRAASKKDGVVAKSEGDVDKGLTAGRPFRGRL